MSIFNRLRAAALAGVLAVTPSLPLLAEPKPAPAAASVDALFAAADVRPVTSTVAFDAGALNSALGDAARLSYTDSVLDAATGATRLTGVRFELLGSAPETLFTANEMLIWSADTKALAARMNGKRLNETLRLFDRIELTDVSVDLTDYSKAIEDAMESAVPGSTEESQAPITSQMTIGRLALSGLTLHPWTHKDKAGEDEGLEAIRLLSAFGRSVSLESATFYDTVTRESFIEDGLTFKVVANYDRQLVQGYDRGDLAQSLLTGADFSGELPMPERFKAGIQPASASTKTATFGGSLAYSGMTGLKLGKLLEYGERGEMPSIKERNLWSLGSYTLQDMRMDFGGSPAFEIGRLTLSADKFAWFLPERLTIEHEDVALHLINFLSWAEDFEASPVADDGEPTVAEMIGILERSGLSKLSGDGRLSLTWNSDTGVTLLEGKGLSDTLYSDETRFEMRLPAYAELVPAFGADGKTPNETSLGKLFEDKFALVGGHYNFTDGGLLDKLSMLTIEVGKLRGEDDPDYGMFASQTPETLRSFIAAMVMFGGSSMTSEVPEASKWLQGFTKFLTDGGTFSVRMAPERPLTAETFESLDAGKVESPSDVIKLFGLSMTHTPEADTGPR